MKRLRVHIGPSSPDSLPLAVDLSCGKVFRIDSRKLADHLVESGVNEVMDTKDFGEIDDEYASWEANGWGEGLYYYLASQQCSFVDGDPHTFRRAQGEILREYARDGGVPRETRERKKGIRLRESQTTVDGGLLDCLLKRRTTLVPKQNHLDFEHCSDILVEGLAKLAEFRAWDATVSPENALVNFGPSLDVYVIVYDEAICDPGVYRVSLTEKSLIKVKAGLYRLEMRTALVGQPAPMTAAVTVVYVSDIKRHWWRYRHERALRGLWIDTAKVVNELLWALARLGVVPHITPAFHETSLCGLLGLDRGYLPMYAISFG